MPYNQLLIAMYNNTKKRHKSLLLVTFQKAQTLKQKQQALVSFDEKRNKTERYHAAPDY